MADKRAAGVGVGTDVGLTAEVIHDAPATTTMYFRGIPTLVPTDEISTFQAHGFLIHQPESMPALCDEVDQLTQEVARTARAFVTDLLARSAIGNDEASTVRALHVAMTTLNGRLQDILNIAHENYPVVEQGETAEEHAHRLAAEAVWNHYPIEEVVRRYGLYGQDAVIARVTALMAEKPAAPVQEHHVLVDGSDTPVPLSQADGPVLVHYHGAPEEA